MPLSHTHNVHEAFHRFEDEIPANRPFTTHSTSYTRIDMVAMSFTMGMQAFTMSPNQARISS